MRDIFALPIKRAHGVVYIPHKIDVREAPKVVQPRATKSNPTPAKKMCPLADIRFTRDRMGRWHAHVQRAPLKAPKKREPKSVGFCDPGVRCFGTWREPN